MIGRRIAGRLLQGAGVVLGVSLLTFLLAEATPGDYFTEARFDPRFSASSLDALRARHGLDRPLPERYAQWLASLARGELGRSLSHDAPVWPLIRPRIPRTLLLAGTAAALAWAAALLLGLTCAARPGGALDRAIGAGTSVLLAVPDLVLLMLFLLLALRTGWFPVGGMTSPGREEAGGLDHARDVLRHLLLPAAALALSLLPSLFRHVRGALVETSRLPFVQAARAQGIAPLRLLVRHVLPAAANPLVTLLGSTAAALLSFSLLTEVVFGWPGLGPLFLEAILARDLHLVLGPVLVSTGVLLLANVAADLLLLAVDPRIRAT